MIFMPISPALRMVRRKASTPRRCPSARGNPRAAAQRPLPSMIIATWRGTSNAVAALFWVSASDIGTTSDREDFLFLCSQHVVDLDYAGVGCFLDLAGKPIVIVLADLVFSFQFFDHVHGVAPNMTNRDARGFGVLVSNLHKFFAPLLVKFWNAQADCLPLGCRRQAEIGIHDRPFDGMDQR